MKKIALNLQIFFFLVNAHNNLLPLNHCSKVIQWKFQIIIQLIIQVRLTDVYACAHKQGTSQKVKEFVVQTSTNLCQWKIHRTVSK